MSIVYLFINTTKMENRIDYIIYQFLLDIGIPENIASQFQFLFEVLFLLILCFIADKLAKKLLLDLFILLLKRQNFFGMMSY